MNDRWLQLLCLVLPLVVVTTAGPAVAQGGADRLAVSAALVADEADEARMRALLYGFGVDADQIELTHGVDRFVGDDDLGLFGPSPAQTCGDLPLSATAFEQALEQAEELFPLAQYERARDQLSALRGRLPCLTAAISTERLHRLYLLEGVALYYTRGRETAHEAFLRALGVDAQYDWRGEFGPGPQEVHIEAARELLGADRALLWIAVASADPHVIVDGAEVDLIDGQARMTLTTSPHLLQVRGSGLASTAMVVDLSGGTVLIDRTALRLGLHELSQGRASGMGGPSLDALAAWLPDNGYRDGFVVLTSRAARLERQTPSSGDTTEVPPRQKVMRIDPVQREIKRPFLLPERMTPYPWHGAVAMSGGLLLYERDGNLYSYGSVLTTALFPALPSMAAGFTWGVATRYVADSDQTVYIVPLQAHIRFGPDHGPLRPHVGVSGVALWLGERVGPQFTAGLLGSTGLDVRPADNRTFGFGAGVSAGYVGGTVVDVHVGVSLQW